MADKFYDFSAQFTDNARDSLQQAEKIARSLGSPYIGTEHLLLGVLSQNSSVGAQLLQEAGVTLDRAQTALNLTPRTLIVGTGIRGLSETAKLTLKMSCDIAQEFHQDFCGTEHILYSILSQKNARATVLLKDMNVPITVLTADIEDYLRHQQQSFGLNSGSPHVKKRPSKKNALNTYGVDITQLARQKKLDTVIGRDRQIERMITILSRRTKNNPVLIGEPGVGKTAIVEGLAQRIVSEQVPEHLLDRKIIQLDLASMIAGTKYRGEFEERIKKVMNDIMVDDKAIVFIDELHVLVGAGSAEGSMDAANILKPALARGKFRLIGATTIEEYRQNIEKDAALERRLQAIIVPEPSTQETVAILKGLKHHYESHHNVLISDSVIEKTVSLAERYVTERFMPDKAIDVLDDAASRLRVKHATLAPERRKVEREINHLNAKMDEAVSSEDYQRAALYKTRISQLTNKLSTQKTQKPKKPVSLEEQDVASAIATMTGIPVSQLVAREAKRLRDLEKHLRRYIIGQEEAIAAVARSIRRSRSGISSTKRPISSFIFMGPTGVGKTELSKVLAREVFGSEKALIKIDMSEFGDRHTAARLIGAPAGYVGYDDSNQLTDKVRRQPYSVILFDEIEKAHPDVLQLLLQILEDGSLTDGKGRHVNFSHSVIILTSNIGAEAMQKEASLGFRAQSKKDTDDLRDLHERNSDVARDRLKQIMRPELINRFDNIIVFKALTKREIRRILDVLMTDLQERLMAKGLRVVLSSAAKNMLIEKGYDEFNGARPLRRAIEDLVEHPIAEGVLSDTFTPGSVLEATVKNNHIVVSLKKEE